MIDIALVIWAWNRGWKAMALIPLGILMVISFFIGFFGGEDILTPIIVLELIHWVVLITMIAVGRKEKDKRGVYYNPAGSPDVRIYNAPAVAPAAPVYNYPAVPVYQAPVIAPAVFEPYKPAMQVRPVEPATARAPINTAKLVLPDNSEIVIKGADKTIGRHDLDRFFPPEQLKYVSRQHIMVKTDGTRYYVEDPNSSNLTKVNDVNITGKGKWELKDGDRIKLADVATLQFRLSNAFRKLINTKKKRIADPKKQRGLLAVKNVK